MRYGKGAPVWPSNSWTNAYLQLAETEEAARKVVKDHEKSIDYDPR